ncbi:MAG: SH3 domain-containing protein [Spirochaetaceae bacterium]|jgi:hypothetical protein|nr:SH3 domain-containing protein [Spirochaetaceae bacterium]
MLILFYSCEKKQNDIIPQTAVENDVENDDEDDDTDEIPPIVQSEQYTGNVITFEKAFEGIDTLNFTEADAELVKSRVLNKEFAMPNHHNMITQRGSGWWGGITWNNEYVGNYHFEVVGKIAVIMFERYAGKKPNFEVRLFLCNQLLFYPVDENDCVLVERLDNTDERLITPDGKYTVMSLYTAKTRFLKAKTTYYPQSILRIDNETGKMEILSNTDKTYSFTSDDFETMPGIVNDNNVRVRAEPNLNAPILEHRNKGDVIHITWVESKNDDTWYRISLEENDESMGWIYSAYVDLIKF